MTTETLTWAPVTERLPDADTTVLICTTGTAEPVWLGYLSEDGWRDTDGASVEVTHWAEMPKGFVRPEVRVFYMRDNHTFRRLSLDVDAAIQQVREEFDAGNTYGMLCSHQRPFDYVHAGNADAWDEFVAGLREWYAALDLPEKQAQEKAA